MVSHFRQLVSPISQVKSGAHPVKASIRRTGIDKCIPATQTPISPGWRDKCPVWQEGCRRDIAAPVAVGNVVRIRSRYMERIMATRIGDIVVAVRAVAIHDTGFDVHIRDRVVPIV